MVKTVCKVWMCIISYSVKLNCNIGNLEVN